MAPGSIVASATCSMSAKKVTSVYVTTEARRTAVANRIAELDTPFRVDVVKGGRRSLEQNAYLWGVCYPVFLKDGGLGEQGWRAEDLHEYFVGECFGWEKLQGFGRTRMRRLKRTSSFNKSEFTDFLAYLQQKAAELGLFIPDPE